MSEINDSIQDLEAKIREAWPVGSVFLSESPVSPSITIGYGTWTRPIAVVILEDKKGKKNEFPCYMFRRVA